MDNLPNSLEILKLWSIGNYHDEKTLISSAMFNQPINNLPNNLQEIKIDIDIDNCIKQLEINYTS